MELKSITMMMPLQNILHHIKNVFININIVILQSIIRMESSSEMLQNQQEDQMVSKQNRNIGSWSPTENLLYIIFLRKYKEIMVSKKKRKINHIFDQMSQFIGSRNSLQCRSHHQKALEKIGQTRNIIAHFKKIVGKEYFKAQYLKYSDGKSRPTQGRVIQNELKNNEVFPVIQNQQIKVEEEEKAINKIMKVQEQRNQVYYPFSNYFHKNFSEHMGMIPSYPIFEMSYLL